MPSSRFAGAIGRELTIESRAFAVTAATAREGYELVEVRAAPALRIDLAIPARWNGRLLVVGNGGYAGEPVDSPMRDMGRAMGLAQGYAVAGSNTGHDADADPLMSFAADRDKLVDYAHRAVHHTALVARALLAELCGKAPDYSYFEGCSTGGRQALIAAQRYPDDFDGIVAGAPVLEFTAAQLWGVKTAQMLAGSGIGDAEMALVSAALARVAGAAPGEPFVLDDPRALDFDVRRDVPGLSEAHKDALAAVYAPADIGTGTPYPGLPLGAEPLGASMPGVPPASGWAGWMYGLDAGIFAGAANGVRAIFGETFLKGMLGYTGTWQDFGFTAAELQGLDEAAALLNAIDPDLAPFAAAGGKLMLYHGHADTALNPERTRLYFEAVLDKLGTDGVAEFARFYLVPGMFHCMGGYAPDRIDMLTPLVAWVEAGTAPGAITASVGLAHVPDHAQHWTRLICPYPGTPTWSGQGDKLDAATWACAAG